MGKEIDKPVFLSEAGLEEVKRNQKIWRIIDLYPQQLDELKIITQKNEGFKEGNWLYFPWNGCLIHLVQEDDYLTLRTNRNKNIITEEEQVKLYSSTVGIAGLSIGNSAALSLVYNGIAKNIKLSDFDRLETSNLNRIRAGLQHVGLPKIEVTSQQIYEINPYSNLTIFNKGLDISSLDEFMQKPKPDIIIEAMDDFAMKIKIRMQARKLGIPVIMMTNLGDRILIDIERYDENNKGKLFNGLIDDTDVDEILNKPISNDDKQKYAVKIVGKENIPKRALDSLPLIGKELVGRPQLMSTVTISGALASYLVRQIILGKKVPSGRKIVKISDFYGIEE